MEIQVRQQAADLINRLNQAGFSAYLVGGCVRDLLLGSEPHDYDLTTNARPEAIKQVFSDLTTIDTGIKHGTVTVVYDKQNYEITTFRSDGEYQDHRHPDSVKYSDNLYDDVIRRDFTINALAWHPDEGLIDHVGGLNDLQNNRLRAIGDPEKRFNEDSLRILRAIRFSAAYGFSIDPDTARAMIKLKKNLKYVSVERIFSEFTRILTSQWAGEVFWLYRDIIGEFLPEIYDLSSRQYLQKCHCLDNSPKKLTLRLAVMLENRSDTDAVLKRLKADHSTLKRVTLLCQHANDIIMSDDYSLKKLLNVLGSDALMELLELQQADGLIDRNYHKLLTDNITDIINRHEAYRISDLAVNGNDMKELGYQGAQIGEVLERLLDMVMAGRVKNQKNALLQIAR